MELKNFLHRESLHHAYLIEGDENTVLPELFAFCENELGCPREGNPDFWHGSFDSMGIQSAWEIKERQSRRPFKDGGKRIFIIAAESITGEAQNALLKLFEEPGEGTHFFLITPRREGIIPTLKSRTAFIKASETDSTDGVSIQKFLEGDFRMRTKFLEIIIEEKDKAGATKFLNNLGVALHKMIQKDGRAAFLLGEVQKCGNYVHDRASSIKMLLEYLALIMPRVK